MSVLRVRARLAVATSVLLLASALGAVASDAPAVDAAPAGTQSFHRSVDVARSGSAQWTLSSNGAVSTSGGAAHRGDVSSMWLNGAPLGVTPTPTGNGYWIMGADGGVFSFGDARFHGSTGGMALNAPIVGMAATPTGGGYWLVASDGGIFAFGDARFYGSTGGMRLVRPVVGMTPTSTGRGYWLVASDGGIFAFGDARFYGSTGGMSLASPVVDIAATPTGRGYWMTAADGGVFSFGDARFHGSGVGFGSNAVAMATTSDGYVQLLSDGRVLTFPGASAPPSSSSGSPTTGPHSFLFNTSNGPARWDPCRPVRIEVNYDGSGSHGNARADMAEVVSRLRAATGLDIRIVGETSSRTRSSNADAIVYWAAAGEAGTPLAGYSYAWGVGGGGYSTSGGVPVIRHGYVVFNRDAPAVGGFGTSYSFGNLALHELGHMFGLGHVDEWTHGSDARNQVMYPSMRALPSYGNGDREGLWRLGAAQGCFATGALSMQSTESVDPDITEFKVVDEFAQPGDTAD